MIHSLILTLSLFFFLSCGRESDTVEIQGVTVSSQSTEILDIYYKSMSSFTIEVLYEEGSEPYTGTTALGKNYWQLFEVNIKELLKLEERGVSFTYPNELSEMKSVSAQGKSAWNVDAIESFFSEHQSITSTSTTGVMNIAFVSGHFEDSDGEVNTGVIGVHVSGTSHIMVFKDVIDSIEESDGTWVARYSEQSVLIHEVGHALGLVDNGLPMSTEHSDVDHGDHCQSDQCVMYWLNEGKDGLGDFIRQYISSGSEVLFGDNCLEDAKDYMSK